MPTQLENIHPMSFFRKTPLLEKSLISPSSSPPLSIGGPPVFIRVRGFLIKVREIHASLKPTYGTSIPRLVPSGPSRASPASFQVHLERRSQHQRAFSASFLCPSAVG